MFVFILKEHFISSRYVVLTSISLFLLLSFYIVTGIERVYLNKNKLLLAIIALSLSYNLFDAATTSRNKSYIKDIALLSVNKIPEKSIVIVNNKQAFYYLTNRAAHLTVCFGNEAKIAIEELHLDKYSCNTNKNSKKFLKSHTYFDYILLIHKNDNYEDLRDLSDFNLKKIIQTKNLKEDKATLYKMIK